MTTKSESEFGVLGCMHKLGVNGEKVGIRKAHWNEFAEDEQALRDFLAWRRGHARIEIVTQTIDCSVAPFVPEGWTVAPANEQVGSRFTGEIVWGPETTPVALHLDPGQQGDGRVVGTELRTRLAGKPVLPANVLDYLLAHPTLIPESWKGQAVFFWGTIYRHADGDLCVRYLRWDGKSWGWFSGWLGGGWDATGPAAVSAS